jgi:hypothetical protein
LWDAETGSEIQECLLDNVRDAVFTLVSVHDGTQLLLGTAKLRKFLSLPKDGVKADYSCEIVTGKVTTIRREKPPTRGELMTASTEAISLVFAGWDGTLFMWDRKLTESCHEGYF